MVDHGDAAVGNAAAWIDHTSVFGRSSISVGVQGGGGLPERVVQRRCAEELSSATFADGLAKNFASISSEDGGGVAWVSEFECGVVWVAIGGPQFSRIWAGAAANLQIWLWVAQIASGTSNFRCDLEHFAARVLQICEEDI